MPTKPKVPLTEMLKDLQDGVLTPEQFNNYLSTGSIKTHANPGAKEILGTHSNPTSLPKGVDPNSFGAKLEEKMWNPNTMLGGIGASLATGATGGAALPAVIAGLLGTSANTKGDVAANTMLGAAGPLSEQLGQALRAKGVLSAVPATGRFINAAKGLVAGGTMQTAAQEIKSLVDNKRLATPDWKQVAMGAGLGTIAGAAGARPAGAPTKAEQKVLDAAAARKNYETTTADLLSNHAQELEAHGDQARQYGEQIASHKNLIEKTTRQVEAAKLEHTDTKDALKDAANVLKTAEDTAGAGPRQDFIKDLNKINTRQTRATTDLRSAKEAEEETADALLAHQKELAAKEKAARTGAVADVNDKAVDVQNVADKLRNGRDAMGQILPKGSQKQGDYLTQNKITVRNLKNVAAKLRSGADPTEFTHSDEDLLKLWGLEDEAKNATSARKTAQEALDQVKLDKAEHIEKGKGFMRVDGGAIDEHAAAAAAEEAAHQKLRNMQASLRSFEDQMSDLKKISTVHDLNAPKPPVLPDPPPGVEPPLALKDKLGAAAEIGGVFMPKAGKVAKAVINRLPDEKEPPGTGLKFLIDQLLARANAGQAPLVANSSPTPIADSSPTPLAPDQPQE